MRRNVEQRWEEGRQGSLTAVHQAPLLLLAVSGRPIPQHPSGKHTCVSFHTARYTCRGRGQGGKQVESEREAAAAVAGQQQSAPTHTPGVVGPLC